MTDTDKKQYTSKRLIVDHNLEYIWIGGNYEIRSKMRYVKSINICDQDLLKKLVWNYDGSSTGQANTKDSEIILKPVRVFKNPIYDFTHQISFIVICETYHQNGEPTATNHRKFANDIFNKDIDADPFFGMEQEYFIIDPKTDLPLGYDPKKKQGQFYCSVGTDNAFGRKIAEEHYRACIECAIYIAGMNAEVAPGQWEFQVGVCDGIEAGDHMLIARYLLIKIAEKHSMRISFDPKPLKGTWNGSGCHVNYSTVQMREGTKKHNGLYYINKAIDFLAAKHDEHMAVYGSGNKARMTGKNETSSYTKFTSGVGDRTASIRIGNETFIKEKGYFEDRRPSANCDIYLVTAYIFNTTHVQDPDNFQDTDTDTDNFQDTPTK